MKNRLNQEEIQSVFAFIAGFDTSRQLYEEDADLRSEELIYDEDERLEYIEFLTFEVADFLGLEKKEVDGHMMIVEEAKLLFIHSLVSAIIDSKIQEIKLLIEANNLIK